LRILFDTNVVLDLLLDRQPFAAPAAELLSKAEAGIISGYLCATTVTTIHYLARKVIGARKAKRQVRMLLSIFEIASVNRAALEGALEGRFRDFEDAVLHEAARLVNADAIVTRNVEDFEESELPVYSCEEMLSLLKAVPEPE
jgi:predicted nucleic acid-binding protein